MRAAVAWLAGCRQAGAAHVPASVLPGAGRAAFRPVVMMSTFRVNQQVVDELLRGRSGPVVRHIQDICDAVASEAKRNVKRDTGILAASIEPTVNVYGRLVVGRVGSPLEYARYLHEGTGIYGPKGKPIVPVTAKALRFKPGRMIGPLPAGQRGTSPEDRGEWVFARSVKGIPPHPFLVEALERISPYPVRILGG